MFTFKKSYFIAAVIIFAIEVFIALYIQDRIIRPYVGDFLVVILMYCFLRSFLNVPVVTTAIGVLLFSYLIELLQYLNIINTLGLENSRIVNLVLGNYFEWIDMLAYTLGIVTVMICEKLVFKNR